MSDISQIKSSNNANGEINRASAASMEFGAGAAGESGAGAGSSGNVDSERD